MLDLIKLIFVGGFLTFIVFLVLIALPKSALRDALKPWLFAVMCIIYIFWPLDLLPEIMFGPLGLVDDAAAGYAAFSAIASALKGRKPPQAEQGVR